MLSNLLESGQVLAGDGQLPESTVVSSLYHVFA